jgi:flavin reductase (DIM6/NTAB) family NADH-FMN oxidoreductase RutF
MKKSLGAKTITYPTPVFVVGTYDKEGKPNVMTASWGGICCSSPPCIAVSIRKAAYSYENIVERKAFTINIPSETYIKEVDFFGLVSGKDNDKFAVTRLTPVKSDLVDAPYVKEFPFALECALLHTIEVGSHTQFVGEIIDIKAGASMLDQNGNLTIENVRPVLFAPGARTYYGIGQYLGKAFSIGKEIKSD